jgi:hypothetical protein
MAKSENTSSRVRSTLPESQPIPEPPQKISEQEQETLRAYRETQGEAETSNAELRMQGTLVGTTDPDMRGTSDVGEFPTEEDTEQGDEFEGDEEGEQDTDIPKDEEGMTSPTSSDVGKQTLTKKDLGYDVYKEGVPEDAVAVKGHEHPGDPSAHEESQYSPYFKRK